MSHALRDPLGIDLHAGVGHFMHAVYAWMAAGVGLSAVTALTLRSEPNLMLAVQSQGFQTLFWPGLAIAVLVVGARLHRLPPTLARVAFLTFSILLGGALAW